MTNADRILAEALELSAEERSLRCRGRRRKVSLPRSRGPESVIKRHCLVVPNAGFEGIVALPSGGVLLAAEREPRALLAYGPFGASAGAAGSAPSTG